METFFPKHFGIIVTFPLHLNLRYKPKYYHLLVLNPEDPCAPGPDSSLSFTSVQNKKHRPRASPLKHAPKCDILRHDSNIHMLEDTILLRSLESLQGPQGHYS